MANKNVMSNLPSSQRYILSFHWNVFDD